MSAQKQPTYQSYLLRLWRDTHNPSLWRASLESAQTGEIHHFSSLEALFAFIKEKAGAILVNSEQNLSTENLVCFQ